MKILLLTDMPPCKDFTGGLVLDQLCRFLPHDSIACYAVMNRIIRARRSSDMDWMPIEYQVKPIERAIRLLPGKFGEDIAKWMEERNEKMVLKNILPKVVKFGRENKVDKLWCLLQGQTMVRLAQASAEALGVPLYTQVWDPFGWWLRANKIDHRTAHHLLDKFDETVRNSRVCATASWAMSEEYTDKYGVKNFPVISSLDSNWACQPATRPNNSEEFVIGLAGQIYARDEWNALISALEKYQWKISGRKIRIRILSRGMPRGVARPKNTEYLGWLNQQKAIKVLSEVDMLYLPYWFSPEFKEEATLSFPSKLVTYLAAGRPIVFHGPDYASPAKYLERNNAALLCYSLEPDKIIETIASLITDLTLYKTLAHNGASAFMRDFTYDTMKAKFYKFLELESID